MSTENDLKENAEGSVFSQKIALQILQTAASVGGAAFALYSFVKEKPFWGVIGIIVVMVSVVLYLIKRRALKKKPRHIKITADDPTISKAIARNLLPFREGDILLGRDNKVKEIVTLVDSDSFQFGFVIGDAGVGKTSVIQAGVLPVLRDKLKFIVFYVPRTKADPLKEVFKTIAKEGYAVENGTSLHELLNRIYATERKRILLIIDQFEEFFISFPSSAQRKPFISELAMSARSDDYRASLLISLRKEFVDDLNDFHPEIRQPTDINCRIKIDNWTPHDAKEVLDTMTRLDGIPFSDELRENIVRDLAVLGLVRPVEMQIVVNQLRNGEIYELGPYKHKNRSHGILTDFIKSVIQPEGIQVPETEVIVGGLLLRLLCNDVSDTKRTVGLAVSEIERIIHKEVARRDQKKFFTEESEIAQALVAVLERCYNQKIIIREDAEVYNLAHDYIVQPIRDATKDIETLEEQANRVLNRYIHTDSTFIPYRQLRFVKKNASKVLVTSPEAAFVIRKSQRRHNFFTAGIITITLLLFIAFTFLTTKSSYEVREMTVRDRSDEIHGHYHFDSTGNLFFLSTADSLMIFDLDNSSANLLSRKAFHFPYEEVKFGSDGRVLWAKDLARNNYGWHILGDIIKRMDIDFDSSFRVSSMNKDWAVGYQHDSIRLFDLNKMIGHSRSRDYFFPSHTLKAQLAPELTVDTFPKFVINQNWGKEAVGKFYNATLKISNEKDLVFDIESLEVEMSRPTMRQYKKDIAFKMDYVLQGDPINFFIDSLNSRTLPGLKWIRVGFRNGQRSYASHNSRNLHASFVPDLNFSDTNDYMFNLGFTLFISKRSGSSPFFYKKEFNTRIRHGYYLSDERVFVINSFGDVLVSDDSKYVLTSSIVDRGPSVQVYTISDDASQMVDLRNVQTDYLDTARSFYTFEKEVAKNKFLISAAKGTTRFVYVLSISESDTIAFKKIGAFLESYTDNNVFLSSPDGRYLAAIDEKGYLKVHGLISGDEVIKNELDLGGSFGLKECHWSKNSDYLYIVKNRDISGGYFKKDDLQSFNIQRFIAHDISNISISRNGETMWIMARDRLYAMQKKTYLFGIIHVWTSTFPKIDYGFSKSKMYPDNMDYLDSYY